MNEKNRGSLQVLLLPLVITPSEKQKDPTRKKAGAGELG
jgi:hypothetical protein